MSSITVMAIVATIVFWPIGVSAARLIADGTSEHLALIGETVPLLLRTTLLAITICIAATVLGVVIAVCLDYIRVPFRRVLWFGVVLSFFTPQYVAAIAWIEIAGANSYLSRLTGLNVAAGSGTCRL